MGNCIIEYSYNVIKNSCLTSGCEDSIFVTQVKKN